MSSLIKNLLFAVGLAFILWLGYTLFIKSDDGTVTQNGAVMNEALVSAQEFLATLQELKTIELKGDVFSDPRFRSLVDLQQEVVPENAGRENPFVPYTEKP